MFPGRDAVASYGKLLLAIFAVVPGSAAELADAAECRLRLQLVGGGVVKHSLKVDAFPIGIDPQRFRRALELPRVQERISHVIQMSDPRQPEPRQLFIARSTPLCKQVSEKERKKNKSD